MSTPARATPDDYTRVAALLRHLERHALRQPGLDELAAAAGLSPGHVQRLFLRWAGVSPKRFVQSLTVAHARALLRESQSVLDTSLAVGLSGPGRLHDLMVSVEAMTPGEVRALGGDLCIAWATVATPVGEAVVATTERGVCALEFVETAATDTVARLQRHWPNARFVDADPSAAAALAARIFGPTAQGSAPLGVVLKGTNFQLQVWRALLRVPRGALVDYGQLAAHVGRPGAARAVGNAVGANPVSVLIPCHRVLRRHGQLGGYRWGTARKLALLGRELSAAEAAVG